MRCAAIVSFLALSVTLITCSKSGKGTDPQPAEIPLSTFYGTVEHRVHGPIVGAIVKLDFASDTTDSEGRFVIAGVLDPTGITTPHHVEVVHPAYNFLSRDSAIGGGKACLLFITKTVDEIKQITEDCFVWDSVPSINSGSDSILCLQIWDSAQVHYTGITRVYVKLPAPTNVEPNEITSATLNMTFVRFFAIDGPGGREVAAGVREVEAPWSENSLTWNTQPSCDTALVGAYAFYVGRLPVRVAIQVTAAYKGASFAYGVRLSPYGDDIPTNWLLRGYIEMASSEYPLDSLRPFVALRYTY